MNNLARITVVLILFGLSFIEFLAPGWNGLFSERLSPTPEESKLLRAIYVTAAMIVFATMNKE